MMMEVGRVHEVVRYPVKSMAGVAVESAMAGWHGLVGDRRLAFRRVGVENGFPWLSASRLPELLAYRPVGLDESTGEPLPTHVVAPCGSGLAIGSVELDAQVSQRCGSRVELTRLKHGIFDEAPISVIDLASIGGIGRAAGLTLDRRRFRANVVVTSEESEPFREDRWVGGRLIFGDGEAGAVVSVTLRDFRCVMINIDPETCEKDARVMKTAVGLNEGFAGVYATVVRAGRIAVGDAVCFAAESRAESRR
ncbi:MAG: MOSC domain-containing protein [Phycisphaerales bacterium]|nr:MOSC domain-containing protein [Phycisphaerales bacterium]